MIKQLQAWLRESSKGISETTMEQAPNVLPDAESVRAFLSVLMVSVDESVDLQLAAIQAWASSHIGKDSAMANDWVTLLRLLKEKVSEEIEQAVAPDVALYYWHELDPLFNHALIEVARLAADVDHATHLEYMADLRRQLDRLNRSKSNFVAVAAHELKTPLTIMEGYTNMIRAELDSSDSKLHLYLEGFSNGTRRLRTIIEDMLDATMLDAHSLDLHFQPVYLHKLLQIVIQNLERPFQQRNVSIYMEPVATEPPIYGDPERLSQVFTKIVENALKYTPDGGRVTIESELTRQEEATADIAGYVDVQVSDTGIGIDPDDLPLIFDKFSTTQDVSLHSSGKTKFKGGGPGLGLSIARGIVEAHGGRVWAESPGHDEENCPGSTFHVELPIRLELPGG